MLPHLILADAAPEGSAFWVIAVVLLAFVIGLLVVVFLAIRAVVRFVRRRTAAHSRE